MSTKVSIEVDARTADVLKTRAAELGVTVADLVAELATLDAETAVASPDETAELDRRWQRIEAGDVTIPQEQVVKWLRTWGSPGYRPWQTK